MSSEGQTEHNSSDSESISSSITKNRKLLSQQFEKFLCAHIDQCGVFIFSFSTGKSKETGTTYPANLSVQCKPTTSHSQSSTIEVVKIQNNSQVEAISTLQKNQKLMQSEMVEVQQGIREILNHLREPKNAKEKSDSNLTEDKNTTRRSLSPDPSEYSDCSHHPCSPVDLNNDSDLEPNSLPVISHSSDEGNAVETAFHSQADMEAAPLTYSAPKQATIERDAESKSIRIIYKGVGYSERMGFTITQFNPILFIVSQLPDNSLKPLLEASNVILQEEDKESNLSNREIVRQMYSWFDQHLIKSTGCNPDPNAITATLKLTKVNNEKRAVDLALPEPNKHRPSTSKFDITATDSQLLNFLSGKRLENKDLNELGIYLGNNLGRMSQNDVRIDKEKREDTLRKVQISELLHLIKNVTHSIGLLSVSNSMATFSDKLQQLESVIQLAINLQSDQWENSLVDCLKFRKTMRDKVLGSFSPMLIRSQLLNSPTLSGTLFEEQTAMDAERASKEHQHLLRPAYQKSFLNKHEGSSSSLRRSGGTEFQTSWKNNKRQQEFPDPTLRKRPRSQTFSGAPRATQDPKKQNFREFKRPSTNPPSGTKRNQSHQTGIRGATGRNNAKFTQRTRISQTNRKPSSL